MVNTNSHLNAVHTNSLCLVTLQLQGQAHVRLLLSPCTAEILAGDFFLQVSLFALGSLEHHTQASCTLGMCSSTEPHPS